MKKTDWTDRMLAALVELYPVETTAYTAAVLNLSESTVKLKARELGLVKMAKSRWMERADYIRNHFQECSFSEIGKALGITRMSVGRIAATIGLKRSSEEKHLISSRIRTQMVKRERRRIVFGLEAGFEYSYVFRSGLEFSVIQKNNVNFLHGDTFRNGLLLGIKVPF